MGALKKNANRVGVNIRILALQVSNGRTKECLYQRSNGRKNGVNEIVAVNKHQFLIHERDGDAASQAGFKAIFLVELRGATDISAIPSLPSLEIPPGVTPAAKKLLVDLLDPRYGLAQSDFPAKIEGLTFGPDLPDGRHLLLVSSDNDFVPQEPTRLMAFAIKPEALPGYEPQRFLQPASPQP